MTNPQQHMASPQPVRATQLGQVKRPDAWMGRAEPRASMRSPPGKQCLLCRCIPPLAAYLFDNISSYVLPPKESVPSVSLEDAFLLSKQPVTFITINEKACRLARYFISARLPPSFDRVRKRKAGKILFTIHSTARWDGSVPDLPRRPQIAPLECVRCTL